MVTDEQAKEFETLWAMAQCNPVLYISAIDRTLSHSAVDPFTRAGMDKIMTDAVNNLVKRTGGNPKREPTEQDKALHRAIGAKPPSDKTLGASHWMDEE